MIVNIIYFLLPIVIAVAVVAFLAGSLFYMFSGDKASNKDRGVDLMSLAIVVATIVLVILLLVR